MTVEATWAVEHGMVVRRFGASPDAPSLVWIHGLGEWSVSFDAIVRHPRLAAFAHVLPDLPGYGRTPWPPPVGATHLVASARGSVHALADHLTEWLRTWTSSPPILVGHSMGGVIATVIAEQLPVRAVVNIDGNLTLGDCTFSAETTRYSYSDFHAHGFATIRAAVYARGATEPALRGYHAALLAANPETFRANATDLVRLSTIDNLAPRLAALRCPHVFVAGVPGGICEASRARLDSVGARWIGIEPSGHWPYIDEPDAFASAIAAFVSTAP
ncbi:MAG: alpha/beta fold hydrolase [Kofleriaceae bacterium]